MQRLELGVLVRRSETRFAHIGWSDTGHPELANGRPERLRHRWMLSERAEV